MIETRLVCGFLDAGKTTYIQDCIQNDYFYKYGKTLILGFEEGEAGYDPAVLKEKNTQIAYYDSNVDVRDFCRDAIRENQPDRIYVEMNAMMQGLKEQFPEEMQIRSCVTWIDWTTMDLYFNNFKQMISQMAADSQQITFRGCPSKELLAPYGQAFQLMNRKASYLRQDPMGYHEKAFDLFLPFSLEEKEITITGKEYLPFWLDAADHPEHYDGKILHFTDPLELRQVLDNGAWSAGRVVMTCCMADLQFMSFELSGEKAGCANGGWITFDALAETGIDKYRRPVLKLKLSEAETAQPPEDLILSPAVISS